MAQSVLRYHVVIVGKFFNKGSWVSETWRKEHPEELDEEPDGPPERIATGVERREPLNLEPNLESAVCVRSSGTPPPHSVRLTPTGRGNPHFENKRANQPTYTGSHDPGTPKNKRKNEIKQKRPFLGP